MDQELEELLKSYDAFLEARGLDERPRFALFQSLVDEVAGARKIPREALERAIRKKYPLWVRAGRRLSFLPPKA